ncbi:hypothetical protein MKX01_004290, partial [Papaver californicum]
PGMSPSDKSKKSSSKEREISFDASMEQGKNLIANKLTVLIEQFQKFVELQTNQKAESSTNGEGRTPGVQSNGGGGINQTFVTETLRPARN